MTRRKQRRMFFVLSLLVFMVFWHLLWTQQVFSFDFFDKRTVQQNVKLGEGYVKESSVDNAVIGTVLSQLSLGNGTFTVKPTNDNVDQLFLNSQVLVNTDLLSLINSSQDPEKAISAHLSHTEITIEEIKQTAAQLDQTAQSYLQKSKECLAQKRAGDQKFFSGVQHADSRLSQAGLDQSLEFAPCYITNRIQANAHAFLSQKVQTNAYLLNQRATLLNTNKDLIVANTAYFEGDILEKLLTVKRQLQQVNTLSFEQFAPSFDFSFNYLNFDYTLPKYEGFVIWPDHIPTFEDPGIDKVIDTQQNPFFAE